MNNQFALRGLPMGATVSFAGRGRAAKEIAAIADESIRCSVQQRHDT